MSEQRLILRPVRETDLGYFDAWADPAADPFCFFGHQPAGHARKRFAADGLLTPDQVATLLAKRQADQVAAVRRRPGQEATVPVQPTGPRTAGERRILLRRQLNGLVAAHHHRTGLPHGKIHAELRRLCGGPPSAQATIEQLEESIATIQTL